jgi:hypothetical protein
MVPLKPLLAIFTRSTEDKFLLSDMNQLYFLINIF